MYQKAKLALELKKIEDEEAKLRKALSLPDKGQKGFQPVSPHQRGNITPQEKAEKLEKARLRRQKKKEEELRNPNPKQTKRQKTLDKKTGRK